MLTLPGEVNHGTKGIHTLTDKFSFSVRAIDAVTHVDSDTAFGVCAAPRVKDSRITLGDNPTDFRHFVLRSRSRPRSRSCGQTFRQDRGLGSVAWNRACHMVCRVIEAIQGVQA